MKNTVDLIKRLIVLIEMNNSNNRSKKLEGQLLSQLVDRFHEILVEEDDDLFLIILKN